MLYVVGIVILNSDGHNRFTESSCIYLEKKKGMSKIFGFDHISRKHNIFIYDNECCNTRCLTNNDLINYINDSIKIEGIIYDIELSKIEIECIRQNFNKILKLLSIENISKVTGRINKYLLKQLGYSDYNIDYINFGLVKYSINSFGELDTKVSVCKNTCDNGFVVVLDEKKNFVNCVGIEYSVIVNSVLHLLFYEIYKSGEICGLSLDNNIFTINTLTHRVKYEIDSDYLRKLYRDKLLGKFLF